MQSKFIRNGSGTLELIPATIDELRGIARYWPMELIGDSDGPQSFGLVFQHGDEEIHGLKLQPPDISEEDAKMAEVGREGGIRHRVLRRPRSRERVGVREKSGCALRQPPWCGCDPHGERHGERYREGQQGALPTLVDVDRAGCAPETRHRGLAMYFIIEGPRVFVVEDQLDEDEPVWQHVVRAGFSKLPYAPMKPAGFPGPPEAGIRHA